ncbi:MAG: 23S rRNA (adenine(2503)-C(2))-methyltransferase RlmN [Anaerovorax sp.]|nr:23S rRNA (adenine(2503)-C(2))-methyltransferase RlmN [Anaerovorax sp.]
MKSNIKEMNLKELESFFQNMGEPRFRAKQVFSWMHRGTFSFEKMTNLSKSLRIKLDEVAEISHLEILKRQISKKDGTRKYLFGLHDGNAIESVYMQYKHGNSICISSQAGCRMGCRFCASTINGLQRNLTASEMVDQVLMVEKDTATKISNVVVMGTGEPFDNYENLCRFLELIHDKDGLNMGLRNVTVSTCGIIPKIKEFAKDYPQVNLAISLHAAEDNARSSLMPINQRYPMDDLLQVCREYVEQTGRRITFEYTLVAGVNDTAKHAQQLMSKLAGILCHINLIPLNTVKENQWTGTKREAAEQFAEILDKKGFPVTIRRELGSDISAACGQLRLNQKY